MLFFAMFYFCFSLSLFCQTEKGIDKGNDLLSISYQAKGTINFSLPELSFSAQFVAKIVGNDSASISFYGPMGVILVKAYSDKNFFEYYDVFNNWAIVGNPTRENIYKASRVPLSFIDIIYLFKGQLLYPFDSLRIEKNDDGKILYSYRTNEFVDFFLVENSRLVQFQKKNYEDKIVVNIAIPEYLNVDEYTFPKKYFMQLEERKGNVSINIDQIEFNVDTSRPFSFNIPKSVEIFNFE